MLEVAERVHTMVRYHVFTFYSRETEQHYYTASKNERPPAAPRNMRMHFTVMAHSEHDAIARTLTGLYTTKDAIG